MKEQKTGSAKRVTAGLLAFLLMIGLPPAVKADEDSREAPASAAQTADTRTVSDASYSEEGVKPVGTFAVTAESFYTEDSGSLPLRAADGVTAAELFQENTAVYCRLTVPEDGLYHIRLSYIVKESTTHRTALSLQINGALPFDAAGSMELDRPWVMAGDVTTDSRGNELLPNSQERTGLTETVLRDAQGRYNEPLYFPLCAGENLLCLTVKNANIDLVSLEAFNEEAVPTYAELKEQYARQGYTQAGTRMTCIEAEHFDRASDSTIMADYDKSDACTSPNDPVLLYYNMLPGARFEKVGQWAEWRFEVESSGLYAISLRVKQDEKSGVVSTRRITVDGKPLCQETQAVTFPYAARWCRQMVATADGEICQFYFEAGRTYTLRVEVIPGALDAVLRELDSIVYELNSLYRSVVMVAGTDSDKYRDYKLASQIPGFKDTVSSLLSALKEQEARMMEANEGKSGSELTAIRSLINRLTLVQENPDSLARTLSSFKSDVESLSSWIAEAKEQPVDFDYIAIHPEAAELPAVRAGFFQGMLFEVRRLLASYTADYGVVGETYDADSAISVWISGGRDQLNVLKKMVDNDYSAKTQTNVSLSLITASIREAVLAGKAPDAALFLSSDEPVNYAIRHAVVDLSRFAEFDEVRQRFDPDALTPFMYEGGCYALPLTETFPMMFVRTDILEELGLTAPDTWEEMYAVAAVLQRKNMEIGILSNLGMFATLLFQNGGSFYTEDQTATAFDSEEAVSAFQMWTSFFSRYGFPISYDFYNRFRSGEMPIGIAAYTTYTMLESAAPEISGRWVMLPIPGTKREDGTVDRSVSISNATGTGTTPGLEQNMGAALIFSTSQKQDKAWDFLNWFTSADAQVQYGEAIEALLGPTARYPTANREAFASLPWDAEQREQLTVQRQSVKLIPEVPGNYYVTREMNNAFRKVIYDYDNAVDTLNRYNVQINKELARKRQQLDSRAD